MFSCPSISRSFAYLLLGECVLAAAHIINCTPSMLLNGTCPFEYLFGRLPSYDALFASLGVLLLLIIKKPKVASLPVIVENLSLLAIHLAKRDRNYMILRLKSILTLAMPNLLKILSLFSILLSPLSLLNCWSLIPL